MVLKSAFVRIGATGSTATLTNISGNVTAITLTYSRDLLEVTAMGDKSKSRLGGLYDWTATIDLNQNYGSSTIDKTFFNMVSSTGGFLTVRPTTASASATNPTYRGHCLLGSYTPIAGGVGEVGTFSVTLEGNSTMSRAITS